ncbi:hypothetical protein BC567DRAFT_89294 [Phyllosticta citribraziliensis]
MRQQHQETTAVSAVRRAITFCCCFCYACFGSTHQQANRPSLPSTSSPRRMREGKKNLSMLAALPPALPPASCERTRAAGIRASAHSDRWMYALCEAGVPLRPPPLTCSSYHFASWLAGRRNDCNSSARERTCAPGAAAAARDRPKRGEDFEVTWIKSSIRVADPVLDYSEFEAEQKSHQPIMRLHEAGR